MKSFSPAGLCSLICLLGITLSEALPYALKALKTQTATQNQSPLTLQAPSSTKGYRKIDLTNNRGAKSFYFDHAHAYKISSPGHPKKMTSAFAFTYSTGNGRMWHDIFGHSPDICLPTSGAKLKGPPSLIETPELSPNTKLEHYIFTHPASREPIHVFKMVHLNQNGWIQKHSLSKNLMPSRLKLLAQAHQSPAATMIISVVFGHSSPENARKQYQEHVLKNCQLTKLSSSTQKL